MGLRSNLQRPRTTYAIKSKLTEAPFTNQRVLMFGHSAGTAEAKKTLIDVDRKNVKVLLGGRSLTTFAYNRFRSYNDSTQIDIVPLTEPEEGVKATAKLVILGTSSENITIKFRMGDDEFIIAVDVLKEETGSEIAIKINMFLN